MAKKYPEEIKTCIKNTLTYSQIPNGDKMKEGKLVISIKPEDSVTGLFNNAQGKTCVLNFASYKEAGGMFTKGSKAQEECLCHESFLYNVLKEKEQYYKVNCSNLNRGLYTNRALYSPDVQFERNGRTIKADVLTCAAPNFYTANKYCNVSTRENSQVLRSRIRFLISILKNEGVETAILGAYGAGVFCQDASEVAKIFKEEINNSMMGCKFNAIFAVPDTKEGNYRKMKAIFEKPEKGMFLGAEIQWTPPKTQTPKNINNTIER
jgi:uncharacterized protein (TIGR02452 family)